MKLALAFLVLAGAAPLAAQAPVRWGDELPPVAIPDAAVVPERDSLPTPAPPAPPPPDSVRALYVTAWAFGTKRLDDLIRLADTTGVNALVIDVKDDTGYLTYRSEVPTAIAIGANRELRAPDTRERLARLHAHGIYPIARIVVAKDPLLARGKPAWAIQDSAGGLWTDRHGRPWVDAFQDSVWIYAAQLAEEAIRLGFAELQFDYVRFPDEPRQRMARARYPGRLPGESTRDGVRRNLTMLRDRVKPLGVPHTIDVFGMTTAVTSDLGIGQVWEDLAAVSDVILPMVYPSHYYHEIYGVSHPNSEPYLIVRRALEDGQRRLTGIESPAIIRPYLQAFTLGPPRYGPEQVQAQIRATHDVGLTGWVLWNPRSVYDPRIFARPARVPALQAAAPADSAAPAPAGAATP